jgi:hypothetical protein
MREASRELASVTRGARQYPSGPHFALGLSASVATLAPPIIQGSEACILAGDNNSCEAE